MEEKFCDEFCGKCDVCIWNKKKRFNVQLMKAKDREVYELCRRYWRGKIYEDPEKYLMNKTVLAWLEEEEKRGKFNQFMITVNPQDEVDVYKFCKLCDKGSNKKYVKEYIWCLEWGGENDHLHAHIKILTENYMNSRIIREGFSSTFGKLGTVNINVKMGTRKGAFEDYVLGLKDGKRKDCDENSKKMRKKYGILDYYTNMLAIKQ